MSRAHALDHAESAEWNAKAQHNNVSVDTDDAASQRERSRPRPGAARSSDELCAVVTACTELDAALSGDRRSWQASGARMTAESVVLHEHVEFEL